MCHQTSGTRQGGTRPAAVGSGTETQLLCCSCRGHEQRGRGPGRGASLHPPHVDRPRPWGTAGPPGHCRRGGTTGKAVSLCTECWQGDNQYFCTGHLGSCPAQSPPRLGLGIQSSCLLSPGGRKLRKEGTTGQSAPSAQLAPGLQGATAGEKKSISRWGRSKNQQRHPAHQPQRGTKGKARRRWSAQAAGRTRAPGTRPLDAGPLLRSWREAGRGARAGFWVLFPWVPACHPTSITTSWPHHFLTMRLA